MVIGIVWFLLGLLCWTGILAGALVLLALLPRGRRIRGEVAYFATVTVAVWSTSLLPGLGLWVWVPILFVAMIPISVLGI